MNKPKLDQINLSTKQSLGVFFIAVSLFTYMGGLAWVSAYWDHELVGTHRGYDIHYFPSINVYGIDIGGEASQWKYNSGYQGAKNMIDSWLDEPEHVETYRDFDIYLISGLQLYYAEGLEETTINYVNSTELKNYIDQAYYPTLVYTIHRDGDTWSIYRQGLEELETLIYWAEDETGCQSSPEYDELQGARQYVYNIYAISEGDTETPGNSTDPVTGEPIGSEYDPPGETVGDRLNAQKNLISGITAAIGIGLVAIDYGQRREK